MVLLGTMISLPVIWQSADIIMALMAMTNLTAILLLSSTVTYRQRLSASAAAGYPAHFDATRYPDIDQQLAPAPGMNCCANNAAITAIDPLQAFLLQSAKIACKTEYADSDFTC